MAVDVVFETHSLSVDNERGLATGWLDGELSATGRLLARELGQRRRDDGLSVVFTSDLGRAVETAELAFAGSPLSVVREPRLRECDYGALNGTSRASPDAGWPTDLDTAHPGGESWRQAIARVTGFLDELARSRAGERVLLIGHMSGWYALEHAVNGTPLEQLRAEPFEWRTGWSYRL